MDPRVLLLDLYKIYFPLVLQQTLKFNQSGRGPALNPALDVL